MKRTQEVQAAQQSLEEAKAEAARLQEQAAATEGENKELVDGLRVSHTLD